MFQVEVGRTQRVPLREGAAPVDVDPGLHPRVDRVLDREVRGRTHEVVAGVVVSRDPEGAERQALELVVRQRADDSHGAVLRDVVC